MCVRAQKYHQNHTYYLVLSICTGFLGGSVVKNLLASAGDSGSVPGLGRSPGEEHGNPLKCSCLGNRTIYWRAAVNGVAKSPIRLGDYTTKTIAIISMKYSLCIRQVRRLKQGYKVYDRCQNLKQGSMAP